MELEQVWTSWNIAYTKFCLDFDRWAILDLWNQLWIRNLLGTNWVMFRMNWEWETDLNIVGIGLNWSYYRIKNRTYVEEHEKCCHVVTGFSSWLFGFLCWVMSDPSIQLKYNSIKIIKIVKCELILDGGIKLSFWNLKWTSHELEYCLSGVKATFKC